MSKAGRRCATFAEYELITQCGVYGQFDVGQARSRDPVLSRGSVPSAKKYVPFRRRSALESMGSRPYCTYPPTDLRTRYVELHIRYI